MDRGIPYDALNYLAEAEQLTLLHTVDAPSPAYTIMLPDEAEAHFGQSQRKEGEHLLERVQALLPPHAGPSTKLLRVGPPADMIVSVAEEQNVDLIVIGARGLGPNLRSGCSVVCPITSSPWPPAPP